MTLKRAWKSNQRISFGETKKKGGELIHGVSVSEIVSIAKGISGCSECDVDDVK